MVVNLCGTTNTTSSTLFNNPSQFGLTVDTNIQRELSATHPQLCAIQKHQQSSPESIFNQQQLAALDTTPFNQYTTATSSASPSSASILLAAQLLFGNGSTTKQIENTSPSIFQSALLSPQQHHPFLMDTSTHQNMSSANSADAGSPSSSHSNSNDLNGNDAEGAEGVWSADIDQAFHEALQIYPPCGRRKIILSEEGKMYGRNELIARYIKIRCGKTRTRKQVSSHIQVLARKKNREIQSKLKTQEIKSETLPHTSFGSPKSADSLNASLNSQISPATLVNAPLFQSTNNGLGGLPPVKLEPKSIDSSLAATPAVSNGAQPTQQQPPQLATAALQWPYNMVPNMFNNNFYGNVTAGINNDENLYANFAAALTAQQFGSSAQANPTSAANQLLSLGGLPALNKILPNLPFPASAASNLFPTQGNTGSETLNEHTIASSKLTLCGFNAYVEKQERIDIVKVPAVIDEPLETIRFDSIKSKFPDLLEDLFRKGPPDAFFLVKCWANLSFDIESTDDSMLYAVDSFYESPHNVDITISSKVCSFGKQAVEKVEVYSANEDERSVQSSSGSTTAPYRYQVEKSVFCDYMYAFIRELKKLETSEMNCVLENFTILQIVQNKQTDETLMVLLLTFEIAPEPESNCRVFRVVP